MYNCGARRAAALKLACNTPLPPYPSPRSSYVDTPPHICVYLYIHPVISSGALIPTQSNCWGGTCSLDWVIISQKYDFSTCVLLDKLKTHQRKYKKNNRNVNWNEYFKQCFRFTLRKYQILVIIKSPETQLFNDFRKRAKTYKI